MRGKTIISPILSQFTHSSTKHHDHLPNGALRFTLIIMIATFTTFVLTRGAASPTSARPPNQREHKTPEYFWSSALSHLFCNCSLPVLYPRDSSSTALEDSSCRLHYPEIALDLLLIRFQINQNETHALRVQEWLSWFDKSEKSLFLRFTAVWIIHLMDPSPVPFLTRKTAPSRRYNIVRPW